MARRRGDRGRARRRPAAEVVQADEAFVQEVAEDEASAKEAEGEGTAVETAESVESADPADSGPEETAPTGQAQAGGVDPDRRYFGPGEAAWIVAEVLEGNETVVLRQLGLGGAEGVDAAAVRAALKQHYGIVAGVDEAALAGLLEQAAEGPVRGEPTVARAVPAKPGEDGRVELVFLEDLGEEGVQLSYAALRAALGRDELEAVLADDLLGLLVEPGQTLAILHPPTEGEAGQDVLGNAVPNRGTAAELRAGENVRADGERFEAETLGYVCVVDGEISVLSPVWVDGDHMEAHFVRFPQPRVAAIQSDWLMRALQVRGVTTGIDEVAIEGLCRAPGAATDKGAALVARGQPAVDGVDGHVDYAIDMEKRAGKLLPDGSVDLRERNAAVGVVAGQAIGELVPPTPGQAGQNLKGESLVGRDGQEHTFLAGENVKVESGDGGRQCFVAEIQGAVSLSGDTIQVRPVYAVSGDVDYSTGNLDLPTDIEVSGSVRSGFTVRAGGSVTVGGSVEPGAQIHARGDVVAAKGIFGDTTKVVALGSVTAKFVQNSTVMAHGDITAGAYIVHGRVRAGGCVRVESGGGRRGGSIIGGVVIAARGVEARLIGSGEGDRTLVGIGPSPDRAGQLAKLHQAVHGAQVKIRKLIVSLGLDNESDEEIGRLLRRASGGARRRVEQVAAELRQLRADREAAQQEQQELEEQVGASLREAWVRGAEIVFADVQVQFGREIRTVSADVTKAEFFCGDQGVRWRPIQETEADDEGGQRGR